MKAVLFDMDGVIINSEWLNAKAGALSFQEQGIKLTKADKKVITGRHPEDFGKLLAKKYSFNRKKQVQRHQYHYRKMYGKVTLLPHSKKLILDLKKKGFKLALVTATPRAIVRRALKRFSLKNAFNTRLTFETCKKRKPAPDVYLLAAKRLKVKKSDCIVIEDSIPGVEAAKRAKMKCIAVTNTNPSSKLKHAGLIVKKLNDKRIRGFLC